MFESVRIPQLKCLDSTNDEDDLTDSEPAKCYN